MKRFILSAFSVVLATAAVAPVAQAAPSVDKDFNLQTLRLWEMDARNKADADFNLQTLRLWEMDARNKSEDSAQPYYYPESAAQPSSQAVSAESDSAHTTEPTAWEAPEVEEDISSPARSLTAQRHQSLDRN